MVNVLIYCLHVIAGETCCKFCSCSPIHFTQHLAHFRIDTVCFLRIFKTFMKIRNLSSNDECSHLYCCFFSLQIHFCSPILGELAEVFQLAIEGSPEKLRLNVRWVWPAGYDSRQDEEVN